MSEGFRVTKERIEIVRKRLTAGEAVRDIAVFFKTTENAIWRIVARHIKKGIKPPSKVGSSRHARQQDEKIDPRVHYVKWPDPRYMSNGYCRNVIGNPKDMKCCGKRTWLGSVYCKEHRNINTKSVSDVKK